MNQKQIISEFKQFLKSRRAWSKWVRNKKSLINEHESKSFMRNIHQPEKLIIRPFPWIKTPEGHEFWSDLNDQWQNRLTELEKSKQS